MNRTYSPPTPAAWTFIIYSGTVEDRHLVEDAPNDESTRATYQLKAPMREWLVENEHTMTIDRGDFGDGSEHFYITFGTEVAADAFAKICDGVK